MGGGVDIPPGKDSGGGGLSMAGMSGPSAAREAERRARVEQAAGSKRMGMVRDMDGCPTQVQVHAYSVD